MQLLKALVLAIASTCVTSAAIAADFTMKIGTPTLNDIQHEWMKRAETRIEARSNGRIEVELFPAAQLGTVPRMIEGLQFGTLEGLVAPSFFFSGLEKRNAVLAAAGLFQDLDHCRRTSSDPEFREIVFPIMRNVGIETLAILCSAPQAFLTKTELNSVSDLEGLKIRVLASPFEIEPMTAFGASPIPMPLGEVAPALQRGTIDGVSSLPIVFSKFKMHTIASHITLTRLSQFAVPVYVSKPWFDSLPPDLQQILREEASAIEKELPAWADRENTAAVSTWIENGGTVSELPAGEQALLNDLALKATNRVLDQDSELRAFYDALSAIAVRN